jgi:hypothetical protein
LGHRPSGTPISASVADDDDDVIDEETMLMMMADMADVDDGGT